MLLQANCKALIFGIVTNNIRSIDWSQENKTSPRYSAALSILIVFVFRHRKHHTKDYGPTLSDYWSFNS